MGLHVVLKKLFVAFIILFLHECSSLNMAFLTKSVQRTENILNSGTNNESVVTPTTEMVLLSKLLTTAAQDVIFNKEISFTPPIVSKYGIKTEYCTSRRVCGDFRETLGMNCRCDNLCAIFNDCCEDIAKEYNFTLRMSQFECVSLKLSQKNTEMEVVAKCSSAWTDDVIADLCQSRKDDLDLIIKVPVSDITGVTFSNMYCAYCNYYYEFYFWTVEQKCVSRNDTSTCELFFDPPGNIYVDAKCRKHDYVSNCSKENNMDAVKMCEQNPALFVYTFQDDPFSNEYLFTKYKNKHCAMCNNADESRLLCHDGTGKNGGGGTVAPPIYSFRLLVDFNELFESEDGNARNCKTSEVYDPVSEVCRQIFCPMTTISFNGRCLPRLLDHVGQLNVTRNSSSGEHDCIFVKLEATEWNFVYNNHTVVVPGLNKTLNTSMFKLNGSDLYICSDEFLDYVTPVQLFNISLEESYLSLFGIVLSITALLITLVVYCILPDLLNLPGKTLTCFMMSLLLAQALFLCLAQARRSSAACKVLAILCHYFYLSSFSWMNVLAFDLLMTFSRSFVASGSSRSRSKRFYFYNMYGWLAPLAIVGTAVAFDLTDTGTTDGFNPKYGNGICWISSGNALILFFAGPLGVFKLIDIIGFVLTSCFIARAQMQGSRASNGKLCFFFLYVKLSMVMGLTWVFAFLAMFTSSMAMWYIFIVFNTSQGVFIAVIFLCTRKVYKLIREKFSRQLSVSSSTKMTLTSSRRSN